MDVANCLRSLQSVYRLPNSGHIPRTENGLEFSAVLSAYGRRMCVLFRKAFTTALRRSDPTRTPMILGLKTAQFLYPHFVMNSTHSPSAAACVVGHARVV
jgi:hypothetical protein